MKKKFLLILVAVLAFNLAILFLVQRNIPEVSVSPATKGTATYATTGNVRVLPEYEIDLIAESSGKIIQTVTTNENGCIPVTKGQCILQMDTTQIDQAIAELKTKIAGLQTKMDIGSNLKLDLANLETDIALYEKLQTQGSYAKEELERRYQDRQRLQRAIALEDLQYKQEMELLELQLEKQKRERSKMFIESPTDGLLTEFFSLPGTTVLAGAKLGKIISDKKLIEINVSEEEATNLALHQEVLIQFLSHKDKLHKGHLTSLYPTTNPRTKQRMAYATLVEEDDEVLPGMTGQASIIHSKRENTLIIPRRALIGRFVYVVKDGKIALREVVPGYIGADYAEILSKLSPGEYVITDNLFSYKNGQRVKPKTFK